MNVRRATDGGSGDPSEGALPRPYGSVANRLARRRKRASAAGNCEADSIDADARRAFRGKFRVFLGRRLGMAEVVKNRHGVYSE